MTSSYTVKLPAGDLTVSVDGGSEGLLSLCDFAARENPKRSFLFVSKVLGKHLPARPSVVIQHQYELAKRLAAALGDVPDALVIGFAETATGLGAGVFEHTQALLPNTSLLYMQTTRYHFARERVMHFQEEHSHATGHLLYAPSVGAHIFRKTRTLVLVDDEFTTGKTCVNFARAFLAVNPNIERVILVSLLNWMTDEQQGAINRITGKGHIISLVSGECRFTRNEGYPLPVLPDVVGNGSLKDALVPLSYGRFGEMTPEKLRFDRVLDRLHLDATRPVHVLGDGEFMHPPLQLAARLEQLGFDTYFQATTRTPVLPGMCIHNKTVFRDHYQDGIPNYVYNLPGPDAQVVLCHESLQPLTLPQHHPMSTVYYKELLCA